MTIVVAPAAEADLADIYDYSHQRWGATQADSYIDSLMLRLSWLSHNHGLCRRRDDIKPGYLSYTHEKHTIWLRQRQGQLQVLRILHVSMDVPRHL